MRLSISGFPSYPLSCRQVRPYLEAIAAYYDHAEERSHGERMRALADAFGDLAKRAPDDDEAPGAR